MAGLESDREILAALTEVEHHEKFAYDFTLKEKGTVLGEDAEVDPIHEGLEFPTEEELFALRRVSDAIPWTAYMIAVVELAERFSVNFIQQPLPPNSTTGAGGLNGQSGALGRGQQMSTGLTTFYQFWSYGTPIAGAYIADTYWGRYKTVCVCVAIAMLGHVIMIISAIPGIIGSDASVGLFTLSLIVTGIGAGGFKSNISPLVAEQYRRTKMFISVTKKGERVIVDPSLTTSRIYMYFYLFINIGALIGQISMVYAEKFVGYWLAYTLPTAVFLLSPLVLWYGHGKYSTSQPTGSVLATAVRVWRYAMRGRWSWNPIKTVRNLTADDFWESAKPSKVIGEKPAWMRFDDNWVEEVRRGFKACSVFLVAPDLFTHGLPNDILSNLDPLALIIFIPLCDLVFYPALVRWRINFKPLQKIAFGFYTGATAMVWAAVVQYCIYKTNPCGYYAGTCVDSNGNPLVSPLNVWIQSGSYILVAISEILASITGLEYAFTKAPRNMRSLVMSMLLFTNAVASAIGEAFVSLSTDPLLVWNYGSVAVICGTSGIMFWMLVRKLNSEEDRLNNMAEGRFD
ncbi:POT family-domain-containing protein [Pisolithus orientalis]|uniref:POT family-domain-containing protein n=1 Tax=Pisolithus orientalis TaxID=936130 RepID=UPI0022252CEA|nr:POT family-domain-containing protein [Pisolithus orientalis]KAI5989801.1 POT family-domain-containing protein [Pisolithus orientalis]